MKTMTTKEIIVDSKILPVDISEIEWVTASECYKLFKEAKDILESIAIADGFSMPFRAREWLKKYGEIWENE